LVSALGKSDRLLEILCRPGQVQGHRPLPAGVRIFGIHSNVRNAAAGDAYVRARVAAFMGLTIVNERRRRQDEAPVDFLCDVTPNRYRRDYASGLPGKMSGREFLDAFASHEDPATTIDAGTVYPVRASTEHAIYENVRVKTFLSCMDEATRSSASQQTMALIRAGVAMYGSDWSYTRIRLGSRETTMLTRLARDAGPAQGVFGARITGGGSGGVVVVLTCAEGAEETAGNIACEYARLSGNEPKIVVAGKSPGAAAFGSRTVVLS
jgi:L-arabinokinase